MATATTYGYKIRMPDGRLARGKVEATSANEALLKVRKLGGIVLDIQSAKSSVGVGKSKRGKIGLKDRIIFTEQLAVMLNAGVNLVQALKGLQEEATNKHLAALLEEVVADVEGGMPFSSALARHPENFSTIYHQMIKASEKTGNVADTLNKLTVQQQKEYDLLGKVRGALIYPAIVVTLMLVVIIVVITFILPKLTGLFTESGTQLPLSTVMLLALSNFMVTKWYIVIIELAALIFGIKMGMRTEKGRYLWDTMKIRLPVLGNFLRKSYMARFCQNFSSLAKAGVPVLEIFQTLKGVVNNVIYEQEIEKVARDVENGVKVSTAIRKSSYFPAMVGQLVSVGEQSGDLAGIFAVLGEFFEKEVDGIAKNLSTLLEPIIMIFMGVGIGFILISVLQPIYGLVNAVQ